MFYCFISIDYFYLLIYLWDRKFYIAHFRPIEYFARAPVRVETSVSIELRAFEP